MSVKWRDIREVKEVVMQREALMKNIRDEVYAEVLLARIEMYGMVVAEATRKLSEL